MKACAIVIANNNSNSLYTNIKKIKKESKCDVVIAILGGNFTQNGEPSIISKKEKVNTLLKNNVDLIIEIPFIYTLQDPKIFAKYVISILNKLKINHLVFKSETKNTNTFKEKYKDSTYMMPHFDFLISDFMEEGLVYQDAMKKAENIVDLYKYEKVEDILNVYYYKEILKNNYNIEISVTDINNSFKVNDDTKALTLNDYFNILKYKLISSSTEELSNIYLIDDGIEHLFKKNIVKANNMDEFINMCSSKQYPYAKIKRKIIHILCNTKEEFAREFLSQDIGFIRVLGFNSLGTKFLAIIKKDIDVPIISKFKKNSFKLLQHEKMVAYIYASILDNNTKNKLYEEEHYVFPIKLN